MLYTLVQSTVPLAGPEGAVEALAWAGDSLIAAGSTAGAAGMLKALRVAADHDPDGPVSSILQASSALGGHENPVTSVAATPNGPPLLASADATGAVQLWTASGAQWDPVFRVSAPSPRTPVTHLLWNPSGTRLAVAFANGTLQLLSQSGEAVWPKPLTSGRGPVAVAWAPDGRSLAVARPSELASADAATGTLTPSNFKLPGDPVAVVWHPRGGLAISLATGRVVLLENPARHARSVETHLVRPQIAWDPDGRLLAAAGAQKVETASRAVKTLTMLKIYSSNGAPLRSAPLPAPDESVTALAWRTLGLQLAVATGNGSLHLVRILRDHAPALAARDLAFIPGSPLCVVQRDPSGADAATISFDETPAAAAVAACDGIALAVSEPDRGCCDFRIIAADTGACLARESAVPVGRVTGSALVPAVALVISPSWLVLWRHRTTDSREAQLYHVRVASLRKTGKLRAESANISDTSWDADEPSGAVAVSARGRTAAVALQDGTVAILDISGMSVLRVFEMNVPLAHVALNADATLLASIDIHCDARVVSAVDPLTDANVSRRKDVWQLQWASDDPQLLGVVQRLRVCFWRQGAWEEDGDGAVSGLLVAVHNQAADVVVFPGSSPELQATWHQVPSLPLRRLSALLRTTNDFSAAAAQVAQMETASPAVWRELGLAAATADPPALQQARLAFQRAGDLAGQSLVRQLEGIPDAASQQAHALAFAGRLAQAERVLVARGLGARAAQILVNHGHADRALALVSAGTADPAAHEDAGDAAMVRGDWAAAAGHFKRGRFWVKLARVLAAQQSYDQLVTLAAEHASDAPLQRTIGELLAGAGLVRDAVDALVRGGVAQLAFQACSSAGEWDCVAWLCDKDPARFADDVAKCAEGMIEQGNLAAALRLLALVGRRASAARTAELLAERAVAAGATIPQLKLLHAFLARALAEATATAGRTSRLQTDQRVLAILRRLSPVALENVQTPWTDDDPWRPCRAYHFWLLAQRQRDRGAYLDAVRTATALVADADFLGATRVHSLVAALALDAQCLAVASGALVQLEQHPDTPGSTRKQSAALAVALFHAKPPADEPNAASVTVTCTSCSASTREFAAHCSSCKARLPRCVATGRALSVSAGAWTCRVCASMADPSVIRGSTACPMCHAAVAA